MKQRLFSALLLLLTVQAAWAQDVTQIVLAKAVSYAQGNAGAPALASQPYQFMAQVRTQTGAVTGGSLLLPGGATLPLISNGDEIRAKASYLSPGGLNGDFPSGTYTFTINAIHDGTRTVSLNLSGDSYPNVPQAANFAESQAVNPAADFTVRWNNFTGGTSTDFVNMQVSDASGHTLFQSPNLGEPGALTGVSAPNFVIPAHTLNPNTHYTCRILFAHITRTDQTSYGQGVVSYAAYATSTEFPLTTTGVPDVDHLVLAKGLAYLQTSGGVTLVNGQSHDFQAQVKENSGGVNSATLLLPSGVSESLQFDGDQFRLQAAYLSQGGLDGDFPDGSYTFTVHAAHDGTRTIPLLLTGDNYPAPPQASNFAAAQHVSPESPFTITWNAFAGGTASDFVSVNVNDETGNTILQSPDINAPGALNGTSPSSFTIPANTLNPNTTYICQILFAKIVQVNTTSYGGGVPAFAGYFALTSFQLSAVAPPDVKRFGAVKGAIYRQTGPGSPTLVDGKPYVFNFFADGSSEFILGASLKLPNGSVIQVPSTNGQTPDFSAAYFTPAALNSDYPPGNYTITFNTTHNGTPTVILPFPAGNFPTAPQILNFAATQAVDPKSDFPVSWTALVGGTTNDYVQLTVSTQDGNNDLFKTPQPGEAGALNGTSTSAVIPANSLAQGQVYQLRVIIAKSIGFDASYALGFTSYFSQTELELNTTGTVVLPTIAINEISPNQWHLHANGAVGQNYVIEMATSLATPVNWQPMVNFTGSTVGFDFNDGVVRDRNFYRVRLGN